MRRRVLTPIKQNVLDLRQRVFIDLGRGPAESGAQEPV